MNKNVIRTYNDNCRRWTIHNGDVQQVLPTLSASLYDAVLSDPPCGLNFMGHGWDSTVPPISVWQGLLFACKPGAFLLAFGGTKTFHRLISNIEDAGWEIRDTLIWLYGEGQPKSATTTLRPAWEPIVLAMKPMSQSFAVNALRFGCGRLNIDGCRIGPSTTSKGRFTANAILDEEAAEALDGQSGHSRSRRGKRRQVGSNIGNGKTLHAFRSRVDAVEGYDDEGGASRFFYVAKAGRKERKGNDHPTVKPLALCEYLARLILPPQRKTPRRLLVPFSGCGSEMLGALHAGWDRVTAVEWEPSYVETARRRLMLFDSGAAVAMPA